MNGPTGHQPGDLRFWSNISCWTVNRVAAKSHKTTTKRYKKAKWPERDNHRRDANDQTTTNKCKMIERSKISTKGYETILAQTKLPQRDTKQLQTGCIIWSNVSLSVSVSCFYAERIEGSVLVIHPWINGMQRTWVTFINLNRQHTHMCASKVRKSFCVCWAASRPQALTLAACLLIPLLGCTLPCLTPSLSPSPPLLVQVIRNLQLRLKSLVLFALSLLSLTSRHQGKWR